MSLITSRMSPNPGSPNELKTDKVSAKSKSLPRPCFPCQHPLSAITQCLLRTHDSRSSTLPLPARPAFIPLPSCHPAAPHLTCRWPPSLAGVEEHMALSCCLRRRVKHRVNKLDPPLLLVPIARPLRQTQPSCALCRHGKPPCPLHAAPQTGRAPVRCAPQSALRPRRAMAQFALPAAAAPLPATNFVPAPRVAAGCGHRTYAASMAASAGEAQPSVTPPLQTRQAPLPCAPPQLPRSHRLAAHCAARRSRPRCAARTRMAAAGGQAGGTTGAAGPPAARPRGPPAGSPAASAAPAPGG